MNITELKQLRVESGLSAKEAARKSNTPYSTWLQWERGIVKTPGVAIVWMGVYVDLQSILK